MSGIREIEPGVMGFELMPGVSIRVDLREPAPITAEKPVNTQPVRPQQQDLAPSVPQKPL